MFPKTKFFICFNELLVYFSFFSESHILWSISPQYLCIFPIYIKYQFVLRFKCGKTACSKRKRKRTKHVFVQFAVRYQSLCAASANLFIIAKWIIKESTGKVIQRTANQQMNAAVITYNTSGYSKPKSFHF